MDTRPQAATLAGLTVLERGWLSSNNILIHDAAGATLVDTGHCVHTAQTLALVQHALAAAGGAEQAAPPQRLARLLNTHLHSDHCGGNAALQAAHGAPLSIPPWQFDAVAAWDTAVLSYEATGQRCARYSAQGVIQPGEVLHLGGRDWTVIAAPGHDPDSVMLFDSTEGLLISADALWGNGFGVVFPELDAQASAGRAFDEVAEVLDLIERLPVRAVVPGHGAPFADVADALARARSRLAAFRQEPRRHDRYAAKVLFKYHLMEEREQALPDLLAWAGTTPLVQALWQRLGGGEALPAWSEALLRELCDSGALAWRDGRVTDA
jgi:glyoxylase-like metal-dependent hydrolase (beta-lactamase superfamily II)